MADAALVGMPSAGKSSLIAKMSAARPKIADYPFTTLVPNLGVARSGDYSFVIADIPGLIEGAHEGRGLGHEFLRHIERTALIVHVVDLTGDWEGRDPLEDYEVINRELARYADELANRPRIVVANKIDVPGTEEAAGGPRRGPIGRRRRRVEPHRPELYRVSATGAAAIATEGARARATWPLRPPAARPTCPIAAERLRRACAQLRPEPRVPHQRAQRASTASRPPSPRRCTSCARPRVPTWAPTCSTTTCGSTSARCATSASRC